MDIRNPQRNAHGGIDCEIRHAVFGWIPFTASPLDVEEYGRQLYALIDKGDKGNVAAYSPVKVEDVEPGIEVMIQQKLREMALREIEADKKEDTGK